MTYKIAMAAGVDAANLAMRKARRREWSREDIKIGTGVTDKLMLLADDNEYFRYFGVERAAPRVG